MKRRTIFILTTLGILSLLVLGITGLSRQFENIANAQEQNFEKNNNDRNERRCTLRKLEGSYGIFANGTVVTPPPGVPAGPFATVGTMVVEENGNATVTLTRSFNGTITREVLPGTVTINEECTGTATFGGVRTFDIVAVNSQDELQFIQTNPGTVVTVIAKRQ
jgi:hypothetical protein